jgi:pimeloyl-ACP methyl ester carboxylesterase
VNPETRYVKSGDVYIAYQIHGEGARDLVFIPGFVSHVEGRWDRPVVATFFERLGQFSRVIAFDKRGNGLSDRVTEIPTLEQRMDDIRAVMDAAGCERAAFFGISEGAPTALLFAATFPQRVSALVLYGGFARWSWAPDHPIGTTDDEFERMVVPGDWGGPMAIDLWAPSVAETEAARREWASFVRVSASPGAAVATLRMAREIDAREVLPVIRVPTLILHRTSERIVRVEQARYMAERIPGAKLVEFPGIDHLAWVGDQNAILDEVQQFLTGTRHVVEIDRVLATVLFTDIVNATQTAVELGDRRWRDLLVKHHDLVRTELTRFRGREIDTAGDGFLASFDAPARAIRCACAIRDAVRTLGVEVRCGLHTGECERSGEKLTGIAVHTGARVAGLAAPGEVLVSQTVRDLVAGSGLTFEARGTRVLKGVPGEWQLFGVSK